MEKSNQYIPGKGQSNKINAPVEQPNVDNQEPLSPSHYFDLGYYGPMVWSAERLMNATLPLDKWLQKNPGKTRWDYQKERENLYKKHFNWLQWLVIPPQVRRTLTKFRQV